MYDDWVQKGWECPKCGRVYSPTTSMCRYCGAEAKTFATTNIEVMSPYMSDLVETLSENSQDMTEEEKKEYNEIIHNLYKPIGINLFDLTEDDKND